VILERTLRDSGAHRNPRRAPGGHRAGVRRVGFGP